MRILYASLTPFPRTGGQTTFLLQMSNEIRGMGHEVEIVSPSQMPSLWVAVADRFSAIIRILFGSWLWFFVRLRILSLFLRLHMVKEDLWNHLDLIDAQDPSALMALSSGARRRGVPLVLTLHGYYHFESNLGSIPADSSWSRRLIRLETRAHARASMIVAVDTRLRDYAVRLGIPMQKIVVRVNSVDCETFRPTSEESKEVERRRLGINPGTKVIICARRLVEKCGVAYAIQAMRVIRDRRIDAVLLVAGMGPLENRLKSMVGDLGLRDVVRFLGDLSRPEMASLLHAGHAAVVPSATIGDEVEASSFSALEAMASGLPVVASDIGGLRDLIKDHVTGILVPEKDPQALAEGIIEATGSIGRTIGLAAREDVLAKFSLENGATDTLTIYRNLL